MEESIFDWLSESFKQNMPCFEHDVTQIHP